MHNYAALVCHDPMKV